jgi:hypothetical protein
MAILGIVLSIVLFVVILVDGFEAMVLPRRVTRPYRFTRFFYRNTWKLWVFLARLWRSPKRRETFLSAFGPLSLLTLFCIWAAALITSFALLFWSLQIPLNPDNAPASFPTYLYLSGETFFTLGFGDVTATAPLGHFFTVMEAGLGFGFMALIIGYLPVLYQAFSRREVTISLLDARAGSPPSVAEMLARVSRLHNLTLIDPFLAEWERWCAELLESHLSYPVLSFYRSQHDNQSWVSALTAVLDTCTFLMAGVKGHDPYQARLTFAMARHAAVDLALVVSARPMAPDPDRLPPERLRKLRETWRDAGLTPLEGAAADAKLIELRGMYEPFVNALAQRFLFTLPPILPEETLVDNWQTSAWMRRTAGLHGLSVTKPGDDHFD